MCLCLRRFSCSTESFIWTADTFGPNLYYLIIFFGPHGSVTVIYVQTYPTGRELGLTWVIACVVSTWHCLYVINWLWNGLKQVFWGQGVAREPKVKSRFDVWWKTLGSHTYPHSPLLCKAKCGPKKTKMWAMLGSNILCCLGSPKGNS